MTFRKIKLSQIQQLIDKPFMGENRVIEGLNLCDRKTNYESIISYVTSEKYLETVLNNNAVKCLFITETLLTHYKCLENCSFFIVENPEIEFYRLHQKLLDQSDFYLASNDTQNLSGNFHPSVIIEDGVKIGKNVKIGYHSVIKKNTIIEDNVTIGENTVIGCEGFQIIYENEVPAAISHVGGVWIKEGAFIAAGSTVSKSLFENYVEIGRNTKIDSQVHIGHNCKIGKNTIITGNSLLMGSVNVGDQVWVAPSSTISNKVNLSEGSFVGSMSLVNRNSLKDEKVMGIPALNFKDYMSLIVKQKKLILTKK